MGQTSVLVILLTLLTVPAYAGLKTIGAGANQEFDSSNFPPDMKKAYLLMRNKCLVCHTMERTVIAITTGIAPVSTTPFEKNDARAYCNRMARKPTSNLSRHEANTIINLMNYMQDQATK